MWTDEKIEEEVKRALVPHGDWCGDMCRPRDAVKLLKAMRADHEEVMRAVRERLRGIGEQLTEVELWETTVVKGEGR